MTLKSKVLIGVEELAADHSWRIFDCRHNLAVPSAGAGAYTSGHIPGALHLHLDSDLSGLTTGANGRHPLPDPDALAHRLGLLGVSNTTPVVAYDDAGGMFAARLWWVLRWLGHAGPVVVLDGGLPAWVAAGLEVTIVQPSFARTMYELGVIGKQAGVVDALNVHEHLHDEKRVLLDARSPDRYRGENETLDPVGGHIPGAKNRFFRENLNADGYFKSPTQLRDEFAVLLDGAAPSAVVSSCGSGVTACHNLLAMELAGLHGASLYAGSWSEWCSDSSRPVAKG